MKVLYKKPGEAPEIREVENDLKPLQELVGGYIETVKVGDVVIICNEEGKLKGLPINFFVNANGYIDAIVGPAIFCRSEGFDFTDIKDEDVKAIKEYMGWRC